MKFNLNSKKSYVSAPLSLSLPLYFSPALTLTLFFFFPFLLLFGPVNGTDKKKFHCLKGTKQLFDLKQDLLAVVLFILYFLGKNLCFWSAFLAFDTFLKEICNLFLKLFTKTFHQAQLTVTPGDIFSALNFIFFELKIFPDTFFRTL